MLDYPLSVFIDTNTIISAKYDFSEKGILYQLVNLVNDKKIKVYLHDVMIGEVIQHIEKDVAAIANSFRKVRSESIKKVSPNIMENSIISHRLIPHPNADIKENFTNSFISFIASLKADILDSSNVDMNTIVNDYFSFNPPFENKEKKRNEFPDAIMSNVLKTIFLHHLQCIYLAMIPDLVKLFRIMKVFIFIKV